jgi:hypothetical protein
VNKGIQLTLMIGPAVPVPVPKVVLDALTSVKVTTTAGEASLFELNFTLSNRSPLHILFLLSGGASIRLVRVVIVVTVNGTPEVLMDGVMTSHQISPGEEAGQSTLTVIGEDLTRVMDYIDFSGVPYPAMPAEARVALVLAKYAVFGIVPMIIPSILMDVPLPVKRIPRHKGKDLHYIRELADDVGYVFYLEPGPAPGTSIAYWGPEIKVGVPQPALNMDMDAHTNVESVNFEFSGESSALPLLFVYNQETKVPMIIPVPNITPLSPPLGAVSPMPKQFPLIKGTAKLSPVQAALIGMAKAARTADVVTGSGTLDVLRYGRILKARRLVGVRGVGPAFDGLHYVKGVTHNIQPGEYKQSFTLARNGLISTIPRVPV